MMTGFAVRADQHAPTHPFAELAPPKLKRARGHKLEIIKMCMYRKDLHFQTTKYPARESRNQNDLTADFADSTDKKTELIRAIRAIRGQNNLRGVRKLSGIVVQNTRKC